MTAIDRSVTLSEVEPFIRASIAEGRDIIFAPHGTSMLPLLREGKDRIVLTAASLPLAVGAVPFYKRDDGHFVLHRIVGIKDGLYELRGDNQTDTESGVRPDQIVAVLKGIHRGDRYIAVDSPLYRFYLRFLLPLWIPTAGLRSRFHLICRFWEEVFR